MAILKIAQMGHPVLRRVADPLPPDQIRGPAVQQLIEDMLDTCDDADGAGLAAPQVHASVRLVVLSLGDKVGMRVWINPEITPMTEELISSYEGCLSVTGMRARVPRFAAVRVAALDREGRPVHLELSGFPAIVAQHECDHLDGTLYVDRCDTKTLAFMPEYRRYRDVTLDSDTEDLEDALEEASEEDGLDGEELDELEEED